MNESNITESINKFLLENNYEVIQCIYPGGQGGIYFKIQGNIIYPDIICFKDRTLYIGENKSLFDESDEEKLLLLKIEENLYMQCKTVLDNYCFTNNKTKFFLENIEMFLGFSKISKKKSYKLINFLVSDSGSVEILKN